MNWRDLGYFLGSPQGGHGIHENVVDGGADGRAGESVVSLILGYIRSKQTDFGVVQETDGGHETALVVVQLDRLLQLRGRDLPYIHPVSKVFRHIFYVAGGEALEEAELFGGGRASPGGRDEAVPTRWSS